MTQQGGLHISRLLFYFENSLKSQEKEEMQRMVSIRFTMNSTFNANWAEQIVKAALSFYLLHVG